MGAKIVGSVSPEKSKSIRDTRQKGVGRKGENVKNHS